MNVVNGFDVSDNGNYFVIASPAQNEVLLMKVISWKEKVFSPAIKLAITATNPVFSSDNNYLAMVVFRTNKTDPKKITSGIEYYSLQTQSMLKKRVPFDSKSINGIYVSDWR